MREVSVLRIEGCLTWLFWRNKGGELCLTVPLFSTTYIRPNIFSATIFTWHSWFNTLPMLRGSMVAKPYLLKDFRWRIGDRKSVDTWKDWWISDQPSLAHMDINNSWAHGINKVADLLVQQPREWDVTKIKEVFPPHLIQAITKVPLLPDGQQDSIIWAQEKYSIFNVKSTYWLIKETINQQQNEHSSTNN